MTSSQSPPERHRRAGRSRPVVIGVVAIVVIGGLFTSLLANVLQRATEDARQQLFIEATDRATAAVVSSATSLQVLLSGLEVVLEDGDATRDELSLFVRRTTSGASTGNAMPGVQVVLLIEQAPGRSAVVIDDFAVGINAALAGDTVDPDSDLGAALQRASRTPLPAFADTDAYPDIGDRLLVSAVPDADGAARWVAILLDRAELLQRPLRGTDLDVALVDQRPGTSEDDRDPLQVRDLEATSTPAPDARERSQLVTIADRTWELTYRALPAFNDRLPTTAGDGGYGAGLVITLLLALVVWNQGSGRVRALEQAADASSALLEREQQFRSLAASSPVGIIATDPDGMVDYANQRLLEILQVDDDIEVLGRPIDRWVRAEDREPVRAAIRAASADGPADDRDVRARLDGDVRRDVRLRFARVEDATGATSGLTGSVEDTTAEVRHREELTREEERHRTLAQQFEHQAMHDPLTGLPNRSHLITRLDEVVIDAAPERAALAFIDLDGFKIVNDALGHAAGDHLLIEVADRLRRCVRAGDLAARLGGDEFALLLVPVEDRAQVEHVAERVLASLEEPCEIDGHTVTVSASIGLTTNGDGEAPSELLGNADMAMYAAKRSGAGNHRWFRPSMAEKMQTRHTLERDLRSALASGAITVVFQPIVDLTTGHDHGAEVLARWHHQDRGPVPPSAFIPVAEETGLIVELGRQVLTAACRAASNWPIGVQLAVNVSGRQLLTDEAVRSIERTLTTTGMSADRLLLELSEADLMTYADELGPVLRSLRELGAQLAIDDFGTGHAALSTLRALPIDVLKIDGSFVSGIDHGADQRAYVDAIVAMARTLDLDIIAEGVETPGQRDVLVQLGIRLAQGYGLALPHDAAAQHARMVDQLSRR